MEVLGRLLLVGLVCGAVVLPAISERTLPCEPHIDWKFVPDSEDCSVYYTCSYGRPTKHSCGPDKAFFGHMCFPKYSQFDLCNLRRPVAFRARNNAFQGFRTTCEPGETGLHAHPMKCAQYYNCSDHSGTAGDLRKPYLRECPPLFLFDEGSKTCRDGTLVDCGRRTRPTSQCDYITNQCLTSHGMPCSLMLPSCDGLPDGNNAWPDRTNSPHYIRCNQGEIMSKNMCGSVTDDSGKTIQSLFNPVSRVCEL